MDYNQKQVLLSFVDFMSKQKREGTHDFRVYHIVRFIVETLSKDRQYEKILTEKTREDICYGALLHDIGKLYIHDSVLNKPDRLSSSEYAEIKKHVIISDNVSAMLKKSIGDEEAFRTACDIINFHHECYDGSGYAGLIVEQIPLSARIVAVADTYDSLRTHKPYKKAYCQSDAMKIICAQSGKKYFPDIVAALEVALAKIGALYAQGNF